VAPANGSQIANALQPVTLTINNALVSDSAASVSYTFEVSTDPAFADKVQTRTVPQTAGQTSVKLDALAPGKDYYWHVRTIAGDSTGQFSGASKFTIGPAVVVQPPIILTPTNGSVGGSPRPTFTVSNAVRSGPVTSVFYRFEIATAATFSPTLISTLVAEGGNGQTSFTPTSDLPIGATIFWRVQALDSGSGITSSFSTVQNVTIAVATTPQAQLAQQQGLVLWPGIQPPGTNGRAKLGPGWDVHSAVAGPGGPLSGTKFTSPRLELLQLYDLIDRGMDPGAGIGWMKSNGYSTDAVWYPEISVVGFAFEYIALIGGSWELVIRVGG